MQGNAINFHDLFNFEDYNSAEVKQIITDLKDLRQTYSDFQSTVINGQLEGVISQQTKLAESIRELVTVTKELSTTTKEGRLAIDESIVKMEALRKSHEDLVTAKQKTIAVDEQNTKVIEQLQEKVLSLAKGYDNLKQGLSQVSTENANLKNQLASARQEIELLTDSLKKANTVYNTTSVQNKILNISIREITAQLETQNASLKTTQIELQKVSQQVLFAAKNFKEGSARTQELREKEQQLIATETQLAAEIAVTTAQLKAKAAQLQKSAQAEVGYYKTVASELSSVKDRMAELVLAGKAGEAEYAALSVRANELSAAQARVRQETTQTTAAYDKFTSIMERMGLRMIASLVIFQAAFELYDAVKEKFIQAWDNMHIRENALADANTKAAESYSQLATNLQYYHDRWLNVTTSMQERLQIIDQVNEKFGAMIGYTIDQTNADDFFINKNRDFIDALKLRAKALADADYWRLAYDKLMKHIDHQNSYVRHLEQQVWGGKTF